MRFPTINKPPYWLTNIDYKYVKKTNIERERERDPTMEWIHLPSSTNFNYKLLMANAGFQDPLPLSAAENGYGGNNNVF